MTQQAVSSTSKKPPSLLRAILWAGFLAGFLDITAAVLNFAIGHNGRIPLKIFNFIASGVFGPKAMSGGWTMVMAGLIFHFMIAYIFTIIFFLLYQKMNILSKNIIITGIVYGIFIWLVMNLIILPMSNTPKSAFNITQAFIGALILIICVGLPISLIARKYYADY